MSELLSTSMCHSNYFLDEVINMVVKSIESADSSKQAGEIKFALSFILKERKLY